MTFGSALTQDVPKGPRPGYVGDSRDRARDVAALDAMIAARPLKPPPLRLEDRRESPGAIQARRAAVRTPEA